MLEVIFVIYDSTVMSVNIQPAVSLSSSEHFIIIKVIELQLSLFYISFFLQSELLSSFLETNCWFWSFAVTVLCSSIKPSLGVKTTKLMQHELRLRSSST